MKKIAFLLLLLPAFVHGQYALQIYDGAKVTLSGSVWLNINQPNVNGIYRNTTTGGIICDNEVSRINWMGVTGTGNYVFPVMSPDGDNVTASVNIGTAGTGSGSLVVSTYHTPNNNTPYPNQSDIWFSDVTNMWDVNGVDNSANAVDRFWLVLYNGYTTMPSSTLTLKYDAIGGTNDLNSIPEADLQAEFWNGATWAPWTPLLGTADPGNDQVHTITGVNFNAPWVLSNRNNPLPVELLNFSFECGKLSWVTASETNCDYYEIYSSPDATDWVLTGRVEGSGNSLQTLNYSFSTELDQVYFKLVQVDFDGSSTAYGPVFGNCSNGEQTDTDIRVYPNPFTEVIYIICPVDCRLDIYDARGRLIRSSMMTAFNEIEMDGLANGLYTLNFTGKDFFESKKVVKNRK